MDSNIFLNFLGYKGEFDSLYKNTMESKSADVFGSSFIVYQLFSVKSCWSNEEDLLLPPFLLTKKITNFCNEDIPVRRPKKFVDTNKEKAHSMIDDIVMLYPWLSLFCAQEEVHRCTRKGP